MANLYGLEELGNSIITRISLLFPGFVPMFAQGDAYSGAFEKNEKYDLRTNISCSAYKGATHVRGVADQSRCQRCSQKI